LFLAVFGALQLIAGRALDEA